MAEGPQADFHPDSDLYHLTTLTLCACVHAARVCSVIERTTQAFHSFAAPRTEESI